MELNRRHLSIGLAVLAIAALAVDKLILGGGGGIASPRGAAAAAIDSADGAAVRGRLDELEAVLGTSGELIARRSFSDELQAMLDEEAMEANGGSLERFFERGSAFQPVRPIEPVRIEPVVEVDPRTEAERARDAFVSAHELESVLHSGDEAIVIVSGRVLRTGAIVDGWRVVRIDVRAVTFEKDGMQAILTVGDRASHGSDALD